MRLSIKVVVTVLSLVTLFMALLFTGLVLRNNAQNDEAMLTTARAIYRNVVITRKWVSDQDGVLVKIQPGMEPNPYLAHPLLVTAEGDTLLMKNPALVTRELSMLSDKLGGKFSYHLASENYLNPMNKPDDFEKHALQYFSDTPAHVGWEYYRLERRDQQQFFRYFAPLYTQTSCLGCHASQGYKEGDLRGGISILISADGYIKSRRSNIVFMLVMAVIAVITLSVLLYSSLQRSIIEPLRQMEIQASRFEDGNYNFDLKINRDDEIGRLATTFQHMGQRIQRFTDQLRKSERKYRRIIENSPEAVAIIDTAGNFIEFNDKLVQLSGYSESELITRKLDSLLDTVGKLLIPPDPELSGEPPFDVERFETTLKSKNSRDIPVDVVITSGLTLEGQENLSFVYLNDLSERKQIEKVWLQTEKMNALGRLSAGIAHEIRNPLFALNNNLKFLKEKLNEDNELNAVYPELESSVVRIEQIISTVLDFARPHQSKMEAVDLNEVIQYNMELLNKHVAESSIELVLELDEHLPKIKGDQYQLGQVVINLAMNAIQAMGKHGTLTLRTRRHRWNVEFIVEDTGSGIDPDDLDKIFDPFFTKSAGGTGLGLAVTQRILEGHQAICRVSSDLNLGTTFTLYFPSTERFRP